MTIVDKFWYQGSLHIYQAMALHLMNDGTKFYISKCHYLMWYKKFG
jgi:hypothetical protein